MVTVKQATGALIDAVDDGALFDFFSANASGFFEPYKPTHLGSNKVLLPNGRGIICGRSFVITQEEVLVQLAPVGTQRGRLMIKVDLGNEEQPVQFVSIADAALPPLVQEDLNAGGKVYELPLAEYSVDAAGISDFKVVAKDISGSGLRLVYGTYVGSGGTTYFDGDFELLVVAAEDTPLFESSTEERRENGGKCAVACKIGHTHGLSYDEKSKRYCTKYFQGGGPQQWWMWNTNLLHQKYFYMGLANTGSFAQDRPPLPPAPGPSLPWNATLEELPSGTKVKLGRIAGHDLTWLTCKDTVTHEARLVLEADSVRLCGLKMYDNAEPNNPDKERKKYGNNFYKDSNIHQWLNTQGAANRWYAPQHSTDTPPNYTNEPGFLRDWTAKELAVLQDTDWPFWRTTEGTEMDMVNARGKIALLSVQELGCIETEEGHLLDIFEDKKEMVISGLQYWTRSAYEMDIYYTAEALLIDERVLNGWPWSRAVKSERVAIRPTCKPVPGTKVSLQEGGYYIIS